MLEKLTMLLMKLSLIITCLIFFQSLVSSPSIRQIDSRASLTAAGGLVIVEEGMCLKESRRSQTRASSSWKVFGFFRDPTLLGF
uniref:Uncharacterized protein n=1 Tax=Sander lucioperca TaxID=283035 RepID=A0A8C9ZFI7_SANLU